MAEFKLGRIRFVWKNEWVTSTTYYKDDVVRFGGKVYLCQIGHTASENFNTDLDINPTKWNLMADGQRWQDAWTIDTSYEEGDLVKYGGTIYLCINGHTSAATEALGLESNSADWNTFVEGTEWKSNWSANTRYKLNDIVRYGGINYICITGHTAAATEALGLEADQAKWQVFTQGQEYKGQWIEAIRYKLNDVVKQGAGLWICTTEHTSSSAFATDSANWSQFVEGFEFEDTWSDSVAYQPGDVVSYGGNNYVAKTLNTGSNPLTETADWDLFSEGMKFQNDWANTTSYKIGEVVKLNGYNYLAITDSPSTAYTVTEVDGVTDIFTTSDTTGMVAGMSIRFTGTTFGDVFTSARYYVREVLDGTTFTITETPGGVLFDASTGTGSMSARVSAEPPNSAYWSAISHGIFWRDEWADDVEYNAGDAVRYGSNTYICKLAHRSEADDGSSLGATGGGQADSRPDLDANGIYWSALSVGSEISVLTTVGDMVYYGGAGPTRLPVGTEGQILRVSSTGIPEWVTWGNTDYIYYVAPSGEDRPYPTCGISLDKPFKTVRYATEQIEKGPRNPSAQCLLELNRAFLQRETTSYIEFQVANAAPGSIWENFDYDEYKCERDVGFVVDRLIWDLGHGGNLKIRAAALSLIGQLGASGEFSDATEVQVYGGAGLAAESEQSVEVYGYLETLIGNVLSNSVPEVIYQDATDSTAVADQYINTDYTAEVGVTTIVSSLLQIITDTITAGDASLVPDRIVPNNTVNIKTGTYTEVLPIIVPAETALIGDETRSTTVAAASATDRNLDIGDAFYTIDTFTHLSGFIGDVVAGNTVTPTAGNNVTQNQDWPVADDADTQAAVIKLVDVMKHQSDYLLGTKLLANYTDPTGYNDTYLVGYGDARQLLKENKKFLQEEIIQFFTDNYPSLKYGKTDTREDVGHIVDALVYDLTYGGFYQTLLAGKAYWDDTQNVSLIPASIVTETLASHAFLRTLLSDVVLNNTITPLQTEVPQFRGTAGSAGAETFVVEHLDIITNAVSGDSTASELPFVTITDIATNVITTSGDHGLQIGDQITPLETDKNLVAGTVYWIITVPNTDEMTISTTYGGSTFTLVDGTGLTLPAHIQDNPAATDAVSSTTALITAAQTLDSQQEALVTAATNYINTQYPDLVYNQSKCERDYRLILEAVMWDFQLNSNFASLIAGQAYLRSSATDPVITGQKAASRAAFTFIKDTILGNTATYLNSDTTAATRLTTLMDLIDTIVFGASNEGDVCQTELRVRDYARLKLEQNREFVKAEMAAYVSETYSDTVTSTSATGNVITISDTSWLTRNAAIRFTGTTYGGILLDTTYYVQNIVDSTTFTVAETRNATAAFSVTTVSSGTFSVELHYNASLCARDVDTYIDALKWDLQWTSNYKSRLVARYYSNAITGSQEEDFFYLRNGTGARNMTLDGLSGDLLPENEYGTSRVSAGAYASLDPGWGPADFRSWIISRSPYVQNVATFGTAAVGQKIDGDLHNGGNKSIVSNDFTQLISDGIGAWVTNNARAELVSVFTYYSHIGYLAENGGRIRGTNGNNSYGDFGSVAEGFDETETPIFCDVDNTAFTASVGSVLTDGLDEILQYEFNNSGSDYTEIVWSIAGGGAGAEVETNDFRDGAVFNVRLIDNVDDSTTAPEAEGNLGGFGYISNANTAQSGTTTSLTIAAVDDEISGAYVGMKVLITAGTGAGQYAIVSSYTAGTKVAEVVKETTGAAGWDNVVAGKSIVAPDASSTYVLEPAISFTAPSYSSTARTLATAQTYIDAEYATTFGVYTPVTGTTDGAGTDALFTVVRKGTKYYAVNIITAGTGYARLDTITIEGTSLGGATTANDLTITVTAINVDTGAIEDIEYAGVGAGGKFVAIASGSQTTNTSVNGTSWIENTSSLPSTSSWVAVSSGKLNILETAGDFVVGRAYRIVSLGNTVFTSIGADANLVGQYFIASGVGSGTGTTTPIASHVVAVSSSTTVNAYSTDGGTTWTAGGALSGGMSGVTVDVAYGLYNGNSRWVAIASDGNTAYSVNGGVSWISNGALPGGTWTSVAYGQGVWVAVSTGSTTAAVSLDGGGTWTAKSLPASSTWISVAYGNNKFVAVSSDGAVDPAYSIDQGATWDDTGIAGWLNETVTSVRYGQGVFVTTNSTSNNVISSEDGINWTTRALTRGSGTGFLTAVQGNPTQIGIWAGIPSASTTAASSAIVGATAKGRAYVADNKIFAIRITDPGSAYNLAPTITITDPNNLYEAPTTVRIGNGAVANPSFINRGAGYDSALAEYDSGDGFADNFQSGKFMAVKRLTGIPSAGANVVFSTQPNTVYKLVNVLSQTGTADGARGAFFQLSPNMEVFNSPPTGTLITTRIRYSQVRLTGHDFLVIGTGNFAESNYPGTPLQANLQANETVDNNGGRVFYTSTDQDGNFRVGELFTIEQSTGIATLNADAFNIAGLSELSLGNITLGGNSATITEFSTDPFLTANSDNVVPTQRAIKAYIAAQIGGGGASLNVNSIVAGFVEIAGTRITTTTGGTIQMKATFNFQGGVTGLPVAWNYYLNN